MRLADQPFDDVPQGSVVAGGEDIEPAIVIEVPSPTRESHPRSVDPLRLGDFSEVPVTVILEKLSRSAEIVEEQVGIVVIVVIDPRATLAERTSVPGNAGFQSHFLEAPFPAAIVIEAIGL